MDQSGISENDRFSPSCLRREHQKLHVFVQWKYDCLIHSLIYFCSSQWNASPSHGVFFQWLKEFMGKIQTGSPFFCKNLQRLYHINFPFHSFITFLSRFWAWLVFLVLKPSGSVFKNHLGWHTVHRILSVFLISHLFHDRTMHWAMHSASVSNRFRPLAQ